jgi:DNA replication protein DnaC
MAYEPSVVRAATAQLTELRRSREEDAEKRRRAVYQTIPRIAEIDHLLRRTMAELFSSALREGSHPSGALAKVKERNVALQAERAELLTAHGYRADALDPAPFCPHCGDSGWTEGKMCSCLKALCAQEQIRELSRLLDLGEQSFDNFNLAFYSPLPWGSSGISPRENMEMVYEICGDYARKFGRYYFNNLFLTGAPGLGKTFLSACIARTVSDRGFSVVYDTAVNIFSRFETQKFARDADDARDARDETRRYLACDLLILDDLGSEMTTPFVQTALYTLVNTRLAAERKTVISSNLSMDDVRRRYSPQIASRIEGEYRALPFFGEDIRLLRKRKL